MLKNKFPKNNEKLRDCLRRFMYIVIIFSSPNDIDFVVIYQYDY